MEKRGNRRRRKERKGEAGTRGQGKEEAKVTSAPCVYTHFASGSLDRGINKGTLTLLTSMRWMKVISVSVKMTHESTALFFVI